MDSWVVSTRVTIKAESKEEAESKMSALILTGWMYGDVVNVDYMPTLMKRRPGT